MMSRKAPGKRRPSGKSAAQPGARAGKARPLRKPVRRTPVWVPPVATVAGLAVLIGAFILIRWATTAPPVKAPSQDTTAAVVAIITNVQSSEVEQVGKGSVSNVITPVNGQPFSVSGKPIVFYYGAEFCPFCAAERWPLIIALSRFGTFAGLSPTTSSSTDVYPDTSTFTFRGATYTSTYIVFQSVEASDRNQNALQAPSADQKAVLAKYDPSGGIPFIDFANRYVLPKANYQPDVISGMSSLAIADALKDPQSPQAQAILGSANFITAAICQTTANQPAAVCAGPAIQALEHTLT